MSDDLFGDLAAVLEEHAPEPAPATPNPVRSASAAKTVVFDIETGPLPWSEIERFFKAPAHPGEFDPAAVKYGRMKDEAKRAEKLKEEQEKHAALVDGWQAEVEAAKKEFMSGAALDAKTAQILAIGYRTIDGDEIDVVLDDRQRKIVEKSKEIREALQCVTYANSETDLLRGFWARYEQVKRRNGSMVGFNIAGFDVPTICWRSWRHGILVPSDVYQNRRYLNRLFVDLLEIWRCGQYGLKGNSCDEVAAFLGTARKNGDGATFHQDLIDDPVKALLYLRNDCLVEWEIGERLGEC